MSIPHRYVTPTYTSPAGFDLFNVTSGGTGAGGSAFMDGAKIGGPNVGTYAVAFGEDATSNHANRGLRALAQNTDFIDNLLYRDIAISVRTVDVTNNIGATTTITLPTSTFLGVAGTPNTSDGLNLIFEILDDSDEEIIDPTSGSTVVVNTVTLGVGDVIGGGGANGMFSGHTVQLNLSPSIPINQTYRVYYGTRSNLATLPADAFTFIKIRGAEEISGIEEDLFRQLHGNNELWNGPWDSTVFDLAHSGIMERYNRSTTATVPQPETYFDSGDLNTTGGGAWFVRQGPALTGYSNNTDSTTDPACAIFATKFVDTSLLGGNTGFVAYGSRLSGTAFTGEALYYPGAATFLSLWPHLFQAGIHATHPYTRIVDGASATLTNVGAYNLDTGEAVVTVTAGGNYWRTVLGGFSAVSLGYDVVEATWSVFNFRKLFMIVAHGSSTDPNNIHKVRIRALDGTIPNFFAGQTGTIRWYSTTFAVGDGAQPYHQTLHSYAGGVAGKLDGLFYQVPPSLSSNAPDDNCPRAPASFSAQNIGSTSKALQWGGFNKTDAVSGPVFPSYLTGDGGINVTGGDVLITNAALIVSNGSVFAQGATADSGSVNGNYLCLGEQTLTVGGGGNVTVDAALGCSMYLTHAPATLTLNFSNVLAGSVIVLSTALTGSTLTWAGAGLTHRFSALDDAQPVGSEDMWVGHVRTSGLFAYTIYWTVTRYT